MWRVGAKVMKKGRKTERDKREKAVFILFRSVKYSAEILDGSDRANSAFYLKRPLEEKCRDVLEIKLSVCGERWFGVSRVQGCA